MEGVVAESTVSGTLREQRELRKWVGNQKRFSYQIRRVPREARVDSASTHAVLLIPYFRIPLLTDRSILNKLVLTQLKDANPRKSSGKVS